MSEAMLEKQRIARQTARILLKAAAISVNAETIAAEIGNENLDVIGGGETAGIPFAAWLADRLDLPMQYVRKKPKGFGCQSQIEGIIFDKGRTLLVEDLATDGRSKVNFCEALCAAGQSCAHAFVFFFYDVFPQARADGGNRHLASLSRHLAGRARSCAPGWIFPRRDSHRGGKIPASPGCLVGGARRHRRIQARLER